MNEPKRPAKIYLDQKLKINGIEVGHTYEGVIYLIHHYEHLLTIATPQQMNDKARTDCAKLIENLKIHKELYETFKPKSNENESNSVPQSI